MNESQRQRNMHTIYSQVLSYIVEWIEYNFIQCEQRAVERKYIVL